MNGELTPASETGEIQSRTGELAPTTSECAQFFQRTDWVSFGLTTILVFAGYWFTLAPDVTFDKSGIYAAGAMHAGVAHPPGFPVWTIYAWVFTKLLPFSNMALRVGISTAVAGALACGLIALMVSRGGVLIVEGIPNLKRLEPRQENLLRITCGCIGGMALGFDSAFWTVAVIADTWPFSVLLFTLTICLLMRGLYAPGRKRCIYIYAGCLMYGLTLSNSQALIPAGLGLQLLIALANRELGREIFFTNSIVLIPLSILQPLGYSGPLEPYLSALWKYYLWIGGFSLVVCVTLLMQTRSFLTRWKMMLLAGGMFLLGLCAYLYLPFASMTNPPINWGYPRTVEGFIHVITRGQYERIYPTANMGPYLEQLQMYANITMHDFGWGYLIAAFIPFCWLHRMRASERKWMLGLLAVYLCLSLLMLALLNPGADIAPRSLTRIFFSASHVVLAIWAGYGLILLGSWLTKPAIKPSAPALSSPR